MRSRAVGELLDLTTTGQRVVAQGMPQPGRPTQLLHSEVRYRDCATVWAVERPMGLAVRAPNGRWGPPTAQRLLLSQAMASVSMFGVRAEEVMTEDPLWIEATATVGEAARILNDKGVRHLPVLDGGVVVGIVSDRDIRSALPPIHALLDNLGQVTDCLDGPVSSVMTQRINAVDPDRDLRDVVNIMIEYRVGAVVVVDPVSAKLVGIISYVDVLRAMKEAL